MWFRNFGNGKARRIHKTRGMNARNLCTERLNLTMQTYSTNGQKTRKKYEEFVRSMWCEEAKTFLPRGRDERKWIHEKVKKRLRERTAVESSSIGKICLSIKKKMSGVASQQSELIDVMRGRILWRLLSESRKSGRDPQLILPRSVVPA